MDPTILNVEQLDQTMPIIALSKGTTSSSKARHTPKDGSRVTATAEEVEEEVQATCEQLFWGGSFEHSSPTSGPRDPSNK